MNWIVEHWKDIAAVIGALYALALVIVKITPTPVDDEALKCVNVVLRTIAKLFGLTLQQGLRSKKTLLFVVLGSSMLSSCAIISGIHKDPAKQYKLSAAVFTESVTVLITMKKAGKFDKEETLAISRVIHMGNDILSAWSEALKDSKDYPGVEHMAPILLQLSEFTNKGNGK